MWVRESSRVPNGVGITLNAKPRNNPYSWASDLNNWGPVLDAVKKARRERAA